MRIAYLDCFSGMSGDMFLGALIDAGVPARLFKETVAALGIGAKLEISRVTRNGISATKVDVFVNGEKELPREVFWEQQDNKHEQAHAHGHADDHSHSGEHSHGDEHSHASEHCHSHAEHEHDHHHPHSHDHAHGRGLSEIKKIIASAAISEGAKETATAIFRALGEAEAKIHDKDIESVHFHEVGAVDAMVDAAASAGGKAVKAKLKAKGVLINDVKDLKLFQERARPVWAFLEQKAGKELVDRVIAEAKAAAK